MKTRMRPDHAAERVRRVQELRRSNAARPHSTRKARPTERRRALREQES